MRFFALRAADAIGSAADRESDIAHPSRFPINPSSSDKAIRVSRFRFSCRRERSLYCWEGAAELAAVSIRAAAASIRAIAFLMRSFSISCHLAETYNQSKSLASIAVSKPRA